ncbi:MAG TPA: hypothetical protein VHA56_13835 [Mucilaginibacter sp.]|nr:hypothetical protein [Mucilaginibacter sp.]
MLRITVLQSDNSNLSFSTFENYNLPSPPNGIDAEVNNDLILNFEDEEEAVTYAEQLENLSNDLDDKSSPQYQAINDIIMSIKNDEFIRSYPR